MNTTKHYQYHDSKTRMECRKSSVKITVEILQHLQTYSLSVRCTSLPISSVHHLLPLGHTCPSVHTCFTLLPRWGWLGFNCGSTFGISGGKWKIAAR